MNDEKFTAERVSKTATFTANGKMEDVFPLFGPFEEKNWAEGWSPVLVYPQAGTIEEGLTFTTKGHVHGEKENTWIINKYQPVNHLIQYMVLADNRYLTITVQCNKLTDTTTAATVTYTFTGLTDEGNAVSKHILGKMFGSNLTDWGESINYYLKTGQLLKHG
jgi:hypothetical protein